jgi:biopolymer transport protein ExbD
MNSSNPRSGAQATINVTPLIDIVLVLLIVFIVLVPGLSKSLAVAIPQAGPPVAPGQVHPETLVVTLDGQGRVFLQREEVGLAGLCERLAPVVMLQPLGLRKVFLKVDGELPHAQAVLALDQIRLASERARRETRLRPGYGAEDGGELRVAVTLLKAQGL